MANRVFIIPRRNDLEGINLNLGDLSPNAGQKNSIYEGTHQNIYIGASLDVPGATVTNGIAYVSGSLNTTLTNTHNDVDADTTGGGNDVSATGATAFGLAAYIFDRVQGGGVAAEEAEPLSVTNANNIAADIVADVEAGTSLTAARLNALCAAEVANTDFDGSTGESRSFGTVEDVLRILSGEIYRLPVKTILAENSGGTKEFYGLAARQAILDAQTSNQQLAQGTFYASGSFLTASDVGYRARPYMVRTGHFNISVAEGVLAGYKGDVRVLNKDYAYTAAAVTQWRPRASDIAGNAIPSTGIHPAIAVYTVTGQIL